MKKIHPEVSVIGVDDREMRRLNKTFRGKNKTTDVLTFVDDDFVEIYISLPVAKRQARQRGITFKQECQRLVAHGLCHVAGYDHHTLEEFKEMRKKEFELLVRCLD